MTTTTITTTSTALHLRYNYNYNQNCNYNSNVTISTTSTALQLELQHTFQLQLQLKFFCTSLHHTTSCSCGWGDHCNHYKNHSHLSVHQWIRSAIHASQQLTSPIVSYLWSFRHRLVRHHGYILRMTNYSGYMTEHIHWSLLKGKTMNSWDCLRGWVAVKTPNQGKSLFILW